MKVLVKLVSLFSFLVILFGFYQLKHKQDIFAQSKMRCCNQGQCKGANCYAPSSIEMGRYCGTYYLTCRECIDFELAGLLEGCQDKKNYYCNDRGVKYYGLNNKESISK
jgi:hypothetical protein